MWKATQLFIATATLFVLSALTAAGIRAGNPHAPLEWVRRVACRPSALWDRRLPVPAVRDASEADYLLAGPTLQECASAVQLAATSAPETITFLSKFPTGNPVDFVAEIYAHVTRHWHYQIDPVVAAPGNGTIDVIRPAATLLRLSQGGALTGDCDEMAVLLLSCLAARNLDARLVLASKRTGPVPASG